MYWMMSLLIASLLCVGPVAAQVFSPEEERFAAMIALDTSSLRDFLHPELLYIHSNGLEETADTHVQNVGVGKIEYTRFTRLQPSRIVTSRKTAFVDGSVRVDGQYEGQPFSVELRYTSVYLRHKGRWLLYRWQSTKVMAD